MPQRIDKARTLNETRQSGGLGQTEFGNILVEVRVSRLAEPGDAERPSPAEINHVAVIFEDLRFCKLVLQVQRDQRLGNFAPPDFVPVEP